jgi:hypothetical protein
LFNTTKPHNRLISRRVLRAASLFGVILLGANLGWWAYRTYQDRPTRHVAVQAAAAFFSVDYHDQAAWTQRLCALSTADGCRYLDQVLAPALWSEFQRNRTVSYATSQAAEKIHNFYSAVQQQPAEIWQVALTLDRAWPQDPDGRRQFEVYVLLYQEEPSGWRFDRILSDDEIERLLP